MMLAHIRKAVVAGLGAAVTAVVAAAQDGSLDQGDWVTVALAGLAVGLATWSVPNKTVVPPM
jgi:hypothetical protein